jgi:hypothetical protein
VRGCIRRVRYNGILKKGSPGCGFVGYVSIVLFLARLPDLFLRMPVRPLLIPSRRYSRGIITVGRGATSVLGYFLELSLFWNGFLAVWLHHLSVWLWF